MKPRYFFLRGLWSTGVLNVWKARTRPIAIAPKRSDNRRAVFLSPVLLGTPVKGRRLLLLFAVSFLVVYVLLQTKIRSWTINTIPRRRQPQFVGCVCKSGLDFDLGFRGPIHREWTTNIKTRYVKLMFLVFYSIRNWAILCFDE